MVMVFVPTTPNPTSGYLLIVPREDVIEIDMSLEEATKVVVSGGMVAPPTRAERDAAKLRRSRQLAEEASGTDRN
jgi:uncharacterized membrane protein